MDNEPHIMPYKLMYGIAVTSAVVYALIVAVETVNAGNPALGVSIQALAWMGVIKTFLGGIAFLLPTVRKPPSDERSGMD